MIYKGYEIEDNPDGSYSVLATIYNKDTEQITHLENVKFITVTDAMIIVDIIEQHLTNG